ISCPWLASRLFLSIISAAAPFFAMRLQECAMRAANVYNYKHKPRVAGEPALPLSRFATGSHFLWEKMYNAFTLQAVAFS
ncbi:MAG: hypothetical protein IKS40_07635, partial [Treponema sp.]|nr:hypothetical protein [Treponema sp.]